LLLLLLLVGAALGDIAGWCVAIVVVIEVDHRVMVVGVEQRQLLLKSLRWLQELARVLRLTEIARIVERERRVGVVIAQRIGGRAELRDLRELGIIKITKITATSARALRRLLMSRNHFALATRALVLVIEDGRDMRPRPGP
jgi:hypothetical protein